MNTQEIVLIGDIIKSRKKFDKEKWQGFHQAIDNINKHYCDLLKIPLIIYSGDSFGGTCISISAATTLILALQKELGIHKANIVLIQDEVTYGIASKDFLKLEGPALWESKAMLEKTKKSDSFFLSSLENPIKTLTLNTIINFILSIKHDWGPLEREVYHKLDSSLKQQEIAESLGITQQYVSKMIKKSKMRLIKEAEHNLKAILDGID